MSITAVRVRKLVSGPGFNHCAVEAESSLEGWMNPEQERERLTQWVDSQIAKMQGRDVLVEDVRALREEKHRLTQQTEKLQKELKDLRVQINQRADLRQLAIEHKLIMPEESLFDDEVMF